MDGATKKKAGMIALGRVAIEVSPAEILACVQREQEMLACESCDVVAFGAPPSPSHTLMSEHAAYVVACQRHGGEAPN
jgi:hypothetical protein